MVPTNEQHLESNELPRNGCSIVYKQLLELAEVNLFNEQLRWKEYRTARRTSARSTGGMRLPAGRGERDC